MQTNHIIISGFGGQGIIAAGKTLANAGMRDGNIVSMLPSYGPEMRGGFANCHVIISEKEIASPIVSKADAVIAMSLPALEKFESKVISGKTLIIDSDLISGRAFRNDISVIQLPATKIAMDAGNAKFSNIVMLGALIAVLNTPSLENITEAIKDLLPKGKEGMLPLEMEVLNAGIRFVKQLTLPERSF